MGLTRVPFYGVFILGGGQRVPTQRYGKAFAAVKVKTPPTKFPVVDRCICGDDDWNNWAACISALNDLGLYVSTPREDAPRGRGAAVADHFVYEHGCMAFQVSLSA